MDKVKFQVPDSDETVDFYVVEQTRINGMDYLLVAEEEEGDSEAFILKAVSAGDMTGGTCQTGETCLIEYEMVDSEEELDYVSKIFASILEDVDFTM